MTKKLFVPCPSVIVILALPYLTSCSGNYEFENETFETMSLDIEDHYFYHLKHEERLDLCISARNHASLGGMGSNDFVSIPPVRQYMITYTGGYKEVIIAIQCPTLPPAYLKRGNSDTEIKIMIRPNKFESEPYEFITELVSDAVKTYFYVPDDENIKPELAEHYLHKMNLVDRSDICAAARKSIPSQYLLNVPPRSSVHRAKILEIHFEDKPRQRYIALQCPSAFYNIYINADAGPSPHKMKVILIKEDPSMEISRDSLISKNSSQKQESSM